MDKITASAYVLMHLTQTDFIVAFVGWLLRVMSEWYRAKHKVTFRRKDTFSNRLYMRENWDRILLSNVFALGLLLLLPELVILIGSVALNRPVIWISGFSALIGLLGFDVVSALLMGGKKRITRLISGEEAFPSLREAMPEEPIEEGRDDATAEA